MSTRKVKLQGPAYWCKVFPENRDLTGFEDALKDIGGQTTIDIDLDADNYEKLKKSRSMKTGNPSPDNEGMRRVKFTRKWTEKFGGGAPTVTKADGTVWDIDDDGLLGNGSEVQVTLSVYDTSRARIVGTRLEAVKVLKAVKYDPDADTDDEPAKEAPKQPTKDLDDEIPF